jgi:Rho termination factor, N-terminal domain
MENEPGNQTPNTPNVSETELREMNVEALREAAKKAGIGSTSGMKKEELVEALVQARGQANTDSQPGSGSDRSSADEEAGSEEVGAGPDEGRVRKGPEMSKSLKYSQEVTSPDEEPEREGRSLATTHHEVIKHWAEERDAKPATVEGTEHDDHLGVLRFDFGDETANLRQVSWEEWFRTFDERRLNFIYQEQRSDGRQSNFFRFDNPGREDA